MTDNPYRVLPSFDDLLRRADTRSAGLPRDAVHRLIAEVVDAARETIASGGRPSRDEILARVDLEVGRLGSAWLLPVINATGVLLHTNLGRAPVSASAARSMAEVAASYVTLEADPETGRRGGRMDEISRFLRLLTGAEAGLVVNNNAAALLLTLSALANGRAVIVSRGEAVEIGGGFRIPDVAVQSGARLVEVGTTNRTYPSDYADAIDESTGAILKVHASNFTVRGFVRSAGVDELAPIARRAGIRIIEDLGSGAILQPGAFGLEREPTIGEQIAAGVDIVTASGDKLLGGPQAGIIAGRAELVRTIERHPLARAVRADKTCLAGMAETLRHYARGEAITVIPIWRMITASIDSLRARAGEILRGVANGAERIDIVESVSAVGGGALPGQELPSIALRITSKRSADAFARSLRLGRPGVFGRIDTGSVLLDLRSVLPESDREFATALQTAMDADRR